MRGQSANRVHDLTPEQPTCGTGKAHSCGRQHHRQGVAARQLTEPHPVGGVSNRCCSHGRRRWRGTCHPYRGEQRNQREKQVRCTPVPSRNQSDWSGQGNSSAGSAIDHGVGQTLPILSNHRSDGVCHRRGGQARAHPREQHSECQSSWRGAHGNRQHSGGGNCSCGHCHASRTITGDGEGRCHDR